MKKLFSLLLAALLLGVLPAAAQEAETPYLVLLEDAPLSLLSEDLTPVAPESGVYLVPSAAEAQALVEKGLASVCAPDCTVELLDVLTVPSPDDSAKSWHYQAIGADYPAAAGLTGKGVRIGVVDSGVYLAHPDLVEANIENGWNYADKNSDVSDTVGHGTFISGLLVAQPDNASGICGLCPGATVVPLKAFTAHTGFLADALCAVEAAWSEYHCDIIHMSFGILYAEMSEEHRQLMEITIATASEHALLVAAAGNGNGTDAYYPAACENVLSVAAVSKDLTRWSNGVSGSQYNETVDLAAPGAGLTSLSTTGGLKTGSGTSYAAPLVSGAAALLLEREPDLAPAAVTRRLLDTAVDLGAPGRDDQFGAGLVSLPRLLMTETAATPAADGRYFVQLPQGGSVITARYTQSGQLVEAAVEALPPYAFGYYTPALGSFLLDSLYRPLCEGNAQCALRMISSESQR